MPDTMSSSSSVIHIQYTDPPVVTTRTLPVTKRVKWLTVDTLGSIEVEELRHGFQFFLQEQHALVLEDVANLAVGVEHVAEFPGAGRARLDARRIAARPRALDAPGALLHDAARARAVAQI